MNIRGEENSVRKGLKSKRRRGIRNGYQTWGKEFAYYMRFNPFTLISPSTFPLTAPLTQEVPSSTKV